MQAPFKFAGTEHGFDCVCWAVLVAPASSIVLCVYVKVLWILFTYVEYSRAFWALRLTLRAFQVRIWGPSGELEATLSMVALMLCQSMRRTKIHT